MIQRFPARYSFAVASCIAVFVALSAQSAEADAFGTGPPNGGYHADNTTHTFCHGSGLDVELIGNVDGRMANLDAQTIYSDSLTGCTSATDVIFLDGNLPTNTRGTYVCTDLSTTGSLVCEQSRITLDPAEINIGNNDEHDTSKTACHEIGHSVGLTHGGTTDCMLNGESPAPPNSAHLLYNGHHVSHIDVGA